MFTSDKAGITIKMAQDMVDRGEYHILVVGWLDFVGSWIIACPYRSNNLIHLTNRTTIIR